MARGGYRPGSGPKKGTKYRPRAAKPDTIKKTASASKKKRDIPPDVANGAEKENKTPLEFMLDAMNDTSKPDDFRARMAVAAAPFMHARKGEGVGKKDEKDQAAKKAASGKFAAGQAPLKVVK
jgi:hypothetical protein